MKNPLNTIGYIYTKTFWYEIPMLVIVDGITHFLHLFYIGLHAIALFRTLLHFGDIVKDDL